MCVATPEPGVPAGTLKRVPISSQKLECQWGGSRRVDRADVSIFHMIVRHPASTSASRFIRIPPARMVTSQRSVLSRETDFRSLTLSSEIDSEMFLRTHASSENRNDVDDNSSVILDYGNGQKSSTDAIYNKNASNLYQSLCSQLNFWNISIAVPLRHTH